MALNPPLLPNRHPAPVQGEYLLLDRKDIEAEITLDSKLKYKGKGKLYLTTLRIVFVNNKNEEMVSFDVPIDLMSQEKFNQPIFGANYISGRVRPLYNLLPCPATFKFWFMSGGTGTFLPLFYKMTDQIRKGRQNNHYGPDPRFIECVANGNLRNVAYVDPNDPSVIFIQQPAGSSNYNSSYYFPQNGAVQPPQPMAYNQGGPGPNNQNFYNSPPVYNQNPGFNQQPVYNNPGYNQPVYSYPPVNNPQPGLPAQNYNPQPAYNPNNQYYQGAPNPPYSLNVSYPANLPPNGQPIPSCPPAPRQDDPAAYPPGYSPPANHLNSRQNPN